MTITAKLLEILCCPVSLRPLEMMSEQKLARLNSYIHDGDIVYIDGNPVEKPFEQALITDDGKVIYAIEDQLPNLLPQQGVGTTQFKAAL